VKGWHEHVWTPREQDSRVIPANPEPRQRTMMGLFKWGLMQWNIQLLQEQMEIDPDG
jgi:hypothetical protein